MSNDSTPIVPTAEASWSRYQQVLKILDDASGDAHPSYQGHDRFWHMPLPELLTFSLYGVRMIAPAPGEQQFVPAAAPVAVARPCCHAPQPKAETTAAALASVAQSSKGRGAASGLILGLSGLAPFDGSQFTALPWGGSRVAPSDITFIQQWIDDGCPETDAPSAPSDAAQAIHTLAAGKAQYTSFAGTTNTFRNNTGGVRVRKNINFLTAEELARFRSALAQMKSLDAYEQDERSFGYWARIHANQCQHSWEQFLTWHRAYLYFFEQRLQDIDPTVTLPYWDWAADHDNVIASIEDMGSTTPLDNGIVPAAYQCWIDQAGIDELKSLNVPQATLDKLTAIVGKLYNSGNRLFIAAGITWGQDATSDQAIIQVLSKTNPLWHYQRWPGGNSTYIFEAYPSPNNITNILQIDNFFTFGSGPEDNHFFGALENVHNLIHNFSGGLNPNYGNSTTPMDPSNPQAGDMVNSGRTAFDPIFWAHHANIDRLWWEWQKQHPNGGPDDPTDVLSPWTMTVGETYSISKLGYEYMQTTQSFAVNNTVPVARFVSAAAPVHAQAVATHRKAEIRIHNVRYTTRPGFYIRVFVNQPDADASTPSKDNPHFVGTHSMFTGLCIGGPGHCAPIPVATPRRKFDLRGRSHKHPANFRIDCTETIAKLRELGATQFQVTLVPFNLDGTAATDALHMDGVSLNFFD